MINSSTDFNRLFCVYSRVVVANCILIVSSECVAAVLQAKKFKQTSSVYNLNMIEM